MGKRKKERRDARRGMNDDTTIDNGDEAPIANVGRREQRRIQRERRENMGREQIAQREIEEASRDLLEHLMEDEGPSRDCAEICRQSLELVENASNASSPSRIRDFATYISILDEAMTTTSNLKITMKHLKQLESFLDSDNEPAVTRGGAATMLFRLHCCYLGDFYDLELSAALAREAIAICGSASGSEKRKKITSILSVGDMLDDTKRQATEALLVLNNPNEAGQAKRDLRIQSYEPHHLVALKDRLKVGGGS